MASVVQPSGAPPAGNMCTSLCTPGRTLLRCRSANAAFRPAKATPAAAMQRQLLAMHRSRLPPARVAETATRLQPPSIDSSMESSFELDELPSTPARPAPQPSTLFALSHIERWTPQLVLYFPFGCALAALRFAMWIGCIALDAPWFRNRTVIDAYLAVLGFKMTWQGEEHIPSERHVLVSNHTTTGDLMILFQRPQRYTHLITTGLPKRVFGSFNLPVFLLPACKDTYAALAHPQQAANSTSNSTSNSSSNSYVGSSQYSSSNGHNGSYSNGATTGTTATHASTSPATSTDGAAAADTAAAAAAAADASASALSAAAAAAAAAWPAGAQEAPVHLFPEGGMTNGRGMLRFSRGFMRFAEGLPVVPVALRCKTSAPSVNSHTLTSSFLANLFWLSFPLFTEMTATALPAMSMEPGESKAAFVQRVQAAIADELGVGVADLNVQQKRKMAAAVSKKR